MKITMVNQLTQEQSQHLFYWRERVFPVEGKALSWAQLSWHLLVFDQGELPIAHLGYGRFSLAVDGGSERSVVGVGGVVVRPEAQGKGVPAELFSYLHHSEHALSLSETFTLFCPERLTGYYQKHGYKSFEGSLSFLQNGIATSSADFVFMSCGAPLVANSIQISSEPW